MRNEGWLTFHEPLFLFPPFPSLADLAAASSLSCCTTSRGLLRQGGNGLNLVHATHDRLEDKSDNLLERVDPVRSAMSEHIDGKGGRARKMIIDWLK